MHKFCLFAPMETSMHKPKRKKFLGAKFTTTLSITLVLFVIGLMAVGGLTAASITKVLREQFTISIEMSDAAAPTYGARLATQLKKRKYAKDAIYISADSALTILSQQLGENPETFLGYNPLHASVELQLTAEYAHNDSIAPIVKRLKQQGGANIESVEYNSSLIDLVNKNLKKLAIALAVIVVLLLLICISLISNAVRMAMHADRFLINTMQLVGATNWFIRRPLIYQNIGFGLIASFLALTAIVGLGWYGMSNGAFGTIAELLIHPVPIAVLVACIVIPGILIPAIAAWISADRYLSHKRDDLYLM